MRADRTRQGRVSVWASTSLSHVAPGSVGAAAAIRSDAFARTAAASRTACARCVTDARTGA